jgi:hypothetical protein
MAWGETMALRPRGDWPAAPGRRRQRRMAARRQRLAVQRPTVSRAATRFEPINFLARGSLCVLVHPCCVLEHPSGSVPLDPLPLQPMSTPACLSALDSHQGTRRTTTPYSDTNKTSPQQCPEPFATSTPSRVVRPLAICTGRHGLAGAPQPGTHWLLAVRRPRRTILPRPRAVEEQALGFS